MMGPWIAYAAQDPSRDIEIVADGKKYGSLLEYKREQIKQSLKMILFSVDLRQFSEKELCDLLIEIQKEQAADLRLEAATTSAGDKPGEASQDRKLAEEDARDVSPSQMRGMLDEYLENHEYADTPDFDPRKVKNIIIAPKTDP